MQGHLWLIDVSQSVDLDHPRALDFLREDCAHANAFFRRAGIATTTTRELFEFIVDPAIHEGNIAAALEALRDVAESRPMSADLDAEPAAKVHITTRVSDLRPCCIADVGAVLVTCARHTLQVMPTLMESHQKPDR